MSDSNVGARHGRNIRNHTFVVNSIINDAIVKKTKPVDLAIMDFQKCFDILDHSHKGVSGAAIANFRFLFFSPELLKDL